MSMSFVDRDQKGKFGEQLVWKQLEAKGCLMSPPPGKSHPFDRMLVEYDKKTLQSKLSVIEVKTKPRMNRRPETGFDTADFLLYAAIHRDNPTVDVMIYMVDHHKDEKRIYCQSISKLIKPYKSTLGIGYPLQENGWNGNESVTLFSIEQFDHFCNLNNEQTEKLNKMTSSSYSDVFKLD